MTLEQQPVNVQELQRLNEAIMMTMDAIRRVVPQLQPQFSQYSQFPQYSQIPSYYPQQTFGQPVDPVTAAYLHGHVQALRSVVGPQALQHLTGIGQFGSPWQQPIGIGQQFASVPWQTVNGHPFGQGSPFLNLSQRPF